MSSHLSLDDIKARLRDGLERFVDDCADELWEAQNRIETLEAASLVQPDPLIVDLAEFYEKEEAETRDTLGRIKKRHETRQFGDESSLIAHYEKNAKYYRVRAEALRRVLAASPLPRWQPDLDHLDNALGLQIQSARSVVGMAGMSEGDNRYYAGKADGIAQARKSLGYARDPNWKPGSPSPLPLPMPPVVNR